MVGREERHGEGSVVVVPWWYRDKRKSGAKRKRGVWQVAPF
jgi:hypothetical protein